MRRTVAEFARNVVQLVYPNACLICDAPEADAAASGTGCASTATAL